MKIVPSKILSNRKIKGDYYSVSVQFPNISTLAKPGQFFMVRVGEELDPLLRRPFSLFEILSKNSFSMLYKVVGKGTSVLSKKRKGEYVSIFGPLGNPFDLKNISDSIIVAGGIGIAGVLELTKRLKRKKKKVTMFYGAKSKDDLVLVSKIRKSVSKIILTTEDGSVGRKGLVTDPFSKFLEKDGLKNIHVYSCGPFNMMKRVAEISEEFNIPTQVSLESRMACGFGVCRGCVVPMKNKGSTKYKTVCKDGPIFNGYEIVFE